MPNRIIKESICSSDNVDGLSWFEEAFFYRLMVNVDDFGRLDARTPILKAKLFPLKNVTDKNIKDALNKLSSVGIIYIYVVDDKPYLQFVTWHKHQTIRNKKSKYPALGDGTIVSDCKIEINCNQLKSIENNCLRNPIQSNPIQNESESLLLGAKVAPSETEKLVIGLILNDGTTHDVMETKYKHYQELYPAVNILQELRNMAGWLDANPKKRKTASGISRFINSWLRDKQDKGGNKNTVIDKTYAHNSSFIG